MTFESFLNGLTIFSTYMDDDGPISIAAEHDEFFVGTDRPVSKEDQKTLKALGWSIDDNCGDDGTAWHAHV